MIRLAAYLRVSDPSDPKTASLDTQLAAIKKLFRGCHIDVYREKHTGADFDARPELTRLRDNLKRGLYQKIAVYALDRLSRDLYHLAAIFYEAQRVGAEIVSCTEQIEDSPEGRLLVAVRGFVAQTEREKIRERTQRGLRVLLEDNKIPGSGVAKFGYSYDKQTRSRVIHPEAGPIVQRIYELAAQGRSIRQIMTQFNAEGLPSPNHFLGRKPGGTRWGKEVIRSILRDGSYFGEPLQWNGRDLGPATPALVSRAVWERAQRTIDRAKTYSGSLADNRKFWMLGGMIYCKCGARMYHGKGPGPGYYYYVCSRKRANPAACRNQNMNVALVEELVWAKVLDLINDPAYLRQAIEQAQGQSDDLLGEMRVRQQALGRAEAAIDRLVELLGQEESPAVQRSLQRKLKALAEEVREQQQALVALQGRLAERGAASESLAVLLQGCRAGLASIVATVSSRDHVATSDCAGSAMRGTKARLLGRGGPSGPSAGPLAWVIFSADPGAEPPREVKRNVLLALGARVVLVDREPVVSLDLPYVTPAASGSGRCQRHKTLRIAV